MQYEAAVAMAIIVRHADLGPHRGRVTQLHRKFKRG